MSPGSLAHRYRFVCIARLESPDEEAPCKDYYGLRCTNCGKISWAWTDQQQKTCPGCGRSAKLKYLDLLEEKGYALDRFTGRTPGGDGENSPPSKNPQAS